MLNQHWQNTHNKELKSLHQFKGHTGSIETVRFNPFDQNKFYSGSHDHSIKLWDLSNGQNLQTLNVHSSGVWCIDISSKDKLMASTSPDSNIVLTDMNSGQKVNTFKGNFTKGYWVQFSPDGNQLVASGMEGSIQLFDVKKGTLLKDYRIDDAIVYNTKFVNKNKIMSCTSKGDILIFDDSLNLILRKHLTEYEIRTICTKNNKFYTSFYDNKVREYVLNSESSDVDYHNEFEAHADIINVLETAHNHDLLFTGSKDSALHIWDMNTNAFVNNLVGHTDQISDIKMQTNGNILISASWDQTVRSYDVSNVQNA